MQTQGLTPRQEEILEFLPASAGEISQEFGIQQSTARDHVSAIKDGADIESRETEAGPTIHVPKSEAPDHSEDTHEDGGKADPPSKQAITKAANKHLLTLENRLSNLLEGTDSPDYDGDATSDAREDVVIHRTDDHIGDVVKDEFGNEIFNVEMARKRVEKVTEKCLRLVDRQEAAGYDFDTAHLLLGGDIVTGENIYDHQPHHIEQTLDAQIDTGAELYLKQIKALAERFDQVQVVCQLGNHGEMRGSGLSKAANADRLVYMMLDKMIRESDLDNIRIIRNTSTNFTNFMVRGHRGHLRHGHNTRAHIGTSSTKKNWRGWKLDHEYDIAYWGHYHSMELDEVHGSPVIRTGSIKPGGEFEEGLSESSKTGATVHGVSDDRPLTWMFPVDFE